MLSWKKGKHRSPWQEDKRVETGLISYTPKALADLQAAIAGHVTQPGFPGYNDDRMVFMHTYQSYPQLIIYATCETDIIAALKFARHEKLKVTCRSGGHSTAGYSSNDQIVLDTSGINYVLVDPETQTARVGAGTMFGKLNRVLHHYGLHVPGGGCETVCVAGYMMGGGYGFTSRLFGMNVDSVLSLRMITPKGEILHCSADHNPDLFWAARGGTGNQFGVLLDVTYQLRPLGKIRAFGLRYPLHDEAGRQTAARVLQCLQEQYSKDGPPKMGHQSMLMYIPVEDKKPDQQKPHLLIRGLYDGTEAECEAALGPLLDFIEDRESQVEIWTKGHYLHVNEILLETATEPNMEMPNVSMNTKPLVDSRLVEDYFHADRWRELIDHFLDAPDKTIFVAMEWYGGAINEVAPDATAYLHRTISVDLFAWAFWTFDTHRQASEDWLTKFGEIAGAMSNGHRYQNYPIRGNEGYLRQYFGANLERLVEVKAKYDPENLFEFGQSIPTELPQAATTTTPEGT